MARVKVLSISLVMLMIGAGCSGSSALKGSPGEQLRGAANGPQSASSNESNTSSSVRRDTEESEVPKASRDQSAEEYSQVRSLPVSVTVEPFCASHGQEILVSVRTSPGSLVNVAVFYSDYQTHAPPPQGYPGETPSNDSQADKEGEFSYEFTVPTDAPFGEGTVDVMAALDREDGSSVGTNETPFRVAAGC